MGSSEVSETTSESADAAKAAEQAAESEGTAKSKKKAESTSADTTERGGRGVGRKLLVFAVYLVVIAVVIAVLALVASKVGRVHQAPAKTMEETMDGNDTLFVSKSAARNGEISVGDVVLFTGTGEWARDYESNRSGQGLVAGLQDGLEKIGLFEPDEQQNVLRVIATGGQTVQCQEGDPGIMVDGEELKEPYLKDPPDLGVNRTTGSVECQGPYFGPVEVPEGSFWMMGDNRTNTLDSRHMYLNGHEEDALVDEDDVVGTAQFRVWPPTKLGSVD